MSKRASFFLFLSLEFIFLFSLPAYATYDTGGGSTEERRGPGAGTEAAIGIFSMLVNQAVKSRQEKAEEQLPEPPPIVTVAEFPVDEELKGPCHAELEVKKGDEPEDRKDKKKKKSNIVFKVPLFIAPARDDKKTCCELQSLEIVNRWRHPIEFRVSGAKTKVLAPGESALFKGDLGQCTRVTALSYGQQEKTDEHLVVEDIRPCCEDLRSGKIGRLISMAIVNFSFKEKDCNETPKEWKSICCEACPGRLGNRFYTPLPPDTECHPGDLRHDEWVIGEEPCANPMMAPEYYPGPIVPNPNCPYKEEGTCPEDYRPCSHEPRLCFEGFVDECIQTERCRWKCCRCVPETGEHCPAGYNACGAPLECPEKKKPVCLQTETCKKPCCQCQPKIIESEGEAEAEGEGHCPSGYGACSPVPAECPSGQIPDCMSVETCKRPCCRCRIIESEGEAEAESESEAEGEYHCPPGYRGCASPVECSSGQIAQCVTVEGCRYQCCKCVPVEREGEAEGEEYSCPKEYRPCGPSSLECPEGRIRDCVKVKTCPQECCRCIIIEREGEAEAEAESEAEAEAEAEGECQCQCRLDQNWEAGQALQVQLISPFPDPDAVRVPLGRRAPLTAEGGDRDKHQMICRRENFGGPNCPPPCESKLSQSLPITMKYRWEIVKGEGELLPSPDEPAVLYQAPKEMPSDPRVKIRLTVDDDPQHQRNIDDEELKKEIEIVLVPEDEPLRFQVGPGYEPGSSQDEREGQCPCSPVYEWEINGALTAEAPGENYTVCPKDFLVLSAQGGDMDKLKMWCQDDECPSPEEELNQSDLVYYEWAPTSGRIIGGRTKKVVFEAPEGPAEVTINRVVMDSGEQARDRAQDLSPVEVRIVRMTLTEIKGLRSQPPGDFSQETDPHAPGRLFTDTQDDGEILAAPNAQRVKLTVDILPNDLDPSELKVRWEIRDPDDSADHPQIDNNPRGGDNTGELHEGAEHWFMQADHTISDQRDGSSAFFGARTEETILGQAKTEVTKEGGRLLSAVYFYYTDDGGDNFKIRAVLEKEGNPNCVQDETAVLTVWRKRFLKVYAMRKENDDQQIHPVGANPGPGQYCISPGANGASDTVLIGGDDWIYLQGKDPGKTPDAIHAGANGICETQANSGGNHFDPEVTQELIHEAYANPDPNHCAYLDVMVTQENKNLTFIDKLDGYGVGNYMHQQADGATHSNYTHTLVGVHRLTAPNAPPGRFPAGASHDIPHIGVSAGNIRRNKMNTQSTNVHEFGHSLLGRPPAPAGQGDDFHDSHSANQRCAFEWAITGPLICSKHINKLRDSVSRSFYDQHSPQVKSTAKEHDSKVSR